MSSVTLPNPPALRPQQHTRFFGVARRGQTYRNLLYVLLAFPLSMLYIWLLVSAFSLFVYSLPGLVVLLALLLPGTWGFATLEYLLAEWLLRVRMPPMAPTLPSDLSYWERLKAHLRNPVTWKSLLYLALKLPLASISFLLVAVCYLVSFLLLLAPLWYVLATSNYNTDWLWADWPNGNGESVHDKIAHSPIGYIITGQVEPRGLIISLLVTALGILIFFAALWLVNGLAAGWGWLARATLGLSTKDLQLAEARAVATRERARAEQSDRSRRELILNASHELRTPVASITAHIESLLMLEGERLPENVRAYLGITLREAERLSALVDDLLMLARADSDELRLRIAPIDAGAVVEEVFQAMEPLARREREISLVHEVASTLPPALADRDRLGQVLMNLVRNAISYTPNGGLVSIALARGGPDTLELTVSDTGTGIAEEDLAHVFERFYRADASRTRATGGSGLGLSIVRDLVRAMGGTVVAERLPEGGTRIRVTLRAATVPATQTDIQAGR
jgi:signal transduction histidine kinase